MSTALEVLGAVLAPATGVALSPLPLLGLLLVLGSPGARAGGVAFAVGWAAGLAALMSLVVVAGSGWFDPGPGSGAGAGVDGSGPGVAVGLVTTVVGVLFWVLAARQLQHRPRPGHPAELPAALRGLASLPPPRVALVAAVLGTVNPKNLGLTISAGLGLADALAPPAGPGGAGAVLGTGVFVLVGSLTVLVPVTALVVTGEAAQPALRALQAWLDAHGWVVMLVLFLVLGAQLVGDGLRALAVAW
ncbi:GAP family protein [Nocardioides bruguierae]|uniref:GAP family protein n=1 Tax=Nocardioides bruguierae TaxID=2945102 RepID=UPI0020217BBD|nr:GAP family protein [Nocardioides bruguierae]MCL8026420.1 GAP family protein [Nocardioides bruguierae]